MKEERDVVDNMGKGIKGGDQTPNIMFLGVFLFCSQNQPLF